MKRLRLLGCIAAFSFVNFLEAKPNLYPEVCDLEEITLYLSEIGFSNRQLEQIGEIQTRVDGFATWLACFKIVNHLKISTLEKLIAILYLCTIATAQIDPMGISLAPAIRERIKIFEKRKFYNLLSEPQQELFTSLRDAVGTDTRPTNAFEECFLVHRSRSDSCHF
jgi:hypothetical protein